MPVGNTSIVANRLGLFRTQLDVRIRKCGSSRPLRRDVAVVSRGPHCDA
jgi:hypothetical protein